MTHAPNRLAAEKSPYLLQHARNPVDWYPWGEEAFAAAREQDRPIFLSVGYATCHWCHVMERESFEDETTAAIMNEHFINVKVDREEHPDVDQLYMAVVQRMTGQGGWPMSVFLAPTLEPYFAGTYFPPDARWGRPGFGELLRRCAQVYHDRRDEVMAQGKKIFDVLAQPTGVPRDVETRAPVVRAATQLESTFDETWGGFGQAPKFPRPMALMMLLRQRLADGDKDGRILHMVDKTCEMMWRGGLYDHVGGGFARYSTDDQWLVPHFEKMLYDNAMLALAYLETHQVTGKPDHLRVVKETLDWTLAEMTHDEGGFFSAQDADSEGEEGLFYLWTAEELDDVLGDEARLYETVYGAADGSNFEGKIVLHLPATLDDAAMAASLERADLDERLEVSRRKLHSARESRERPLLDDKVLTSWNGLMIAAMARCGAVTGTERWVAAAQRAARFVLDRLTHEDGRGLLRRWREGDARFEGTLEDYAFLSWGLLHLFEADHDPEWLERAVSLAEVAVDRFGADDGSFFFTPADTPHLGVRMRESYDGATPSGKSLMVDVLGWLAELTGDRSLHERARAAVASSAAELESWPHGMAMLCCGVDRLLAEPTEVVIAAADDDCPMAADMLARARAGFAPHTVVIVVRPSTRARLEAVAPWLADRGTVEGKTAAWVCRGFACQVPVTDVDSMVL